MHLCPVIVDAVDREAESHADSAALCLRRQDIVQHGTRNAVNRRVFRSSDVGIRCTRLDASRIVAELPPHERRTALDACVGESQFRKRTQLVGWLNNSNAIDGPIALNFNDVGGDARTGKPDSGCQTAYATAYNEYSLNRGHANYSKFVPVGYALHTISLLKPVGCAYPLHSGSSNRSPDRSHHRIVKRSAVGPLIIEIVYKRGDGPTGAGRHE